jgi:hypothetical protein
VLLTVAAGARIVDTVARRIEPLDKARPSAHRPPPPSHLLLSQDAALRMAQRAKALQRPGAALRVLLQYRTGDGLLPLSLAAFAVRRLAADLADDELMELNAALDTVPVRRTLMSPLGQSC